MRVKDMEEEAVKRAEAAAKKKRTWQPRSTGRRSLGQPALRPNATTPASFHTPWQS